MERSQTGDLDSDPITAAKPLILASTSRYRSELLSRLRIPFEVQAPGIDEQEERGEKPQNRAERLAREKAQAVAKRYPGRWVLGSDQVAYMGHLILHKPGSAEANIESLLKLSGCRVHFATAISLSHSMGALINDLDVTTVRFRQLRRADVERYVDREPAHDCAGGFKVEGLGISLFESVDSQDPTALIGLPLIALCRMLELTGLAVP